MPDIIRLLPDSVANQIAAGEVVQRPASAVKELLENSIDSGAKEIRLVIRDAGKTLIQVTDNGCGMSERDARMCFERHATSKIQSADDLLAIRTLGFRGEALASVSSVSQVELRTRRVEDEVGTKVIIEGSEVRSHEPCSTHVGTSVLVRNLFFNVPARRNFLKSNFYEYKCILEEFIRVALVHPDLSFILINQDKVQFQLHPSKLKQRIVSLFGTHFNQRLIPVEQQTELVNISGYIGKPEFSKKTRGDQYFFTNGRYIRNLSLHHAMSNSFKGLISADAYPTYFIYLELDPAIIDVNIHPSKTEINFIDINSIYAILQSAVRQSLGTYNVTPVLDFEQEITMDVSPLKPGEAVTQPKITINPDYNPFEKKTESQSSLRFRNAERSIQGSPLSMGFPERKAPYPAIPVQPLKDHIEALEQEMQAVLLPESDWDDFQVFQIANTYLVSSSRKGLLIIDQQRAHERIVFEEILSRKSSEAVVLKKIIPVTVNVSPQDAVVISGHLDDFRTLGFEISGFGNNTFIIHSVPGDVDVPDPAEALEKTIGYIQEEIPEKKEDTRVIIARSLAKSLAVKKGKRLQKEEMESIFQKLFACKVPEFSPEGKPVLFSISFDEMAKKLKS